MPPSPQHSAALSEGEHAVAEPSEDAVAQPAPASTPCENTNNCKLHDGSINLLPSTRWGSFVSGFDVQFILKFFFAMKLICAVARPLLVLQFE